MTAGLVAGMVSWIGEEAVYGYFRPEFQLPPNFARMSPYEKTDVLADLTRKATPASEQKNTATAYGLLGATLGMALGLVGGVVRRSPRAAAVAAIVGLVAGGAVGVGTSAVSTQYFYRNLEPESGMTLALVTHGGIWIPIGLAGGLAFGLGLGRTRSVILSLLGGLAGGVLGTMLFEVANAIAFPLVRVLEPVPAERLPRLMAFLGVAVLVALGAALGVQERTRRDALSKGLT